MSPLGIEIMLHYSYTPARWTKPSPAAADAHTYFVEVGMLDLRDVDGVPHYEITDCGRAYVEFLKRVPVPTRKVQWTIELETGTWLSRDSQLVS